MVKVYMSVDMEGVAGISHGKPTNRGDDLYPQAVELMTAEANAAIEGAYAGGATDVTVNDSHGQMYNLTPEKLDSRARLVQGKKPLSMVEAARDGGFDVALFVGYHARAGHPRGTLAHTYTGMITLVQLNDRALTEAAMNGLYLGAIGVPVGMISGDDALADEARGVVPLGRACRRQAWRELAGGGLAASIEGTRADQRGRRKAVERVASHDPALVPLTMEPPLRLRIAFQQPGQADVAATIPGFTRVGDRGIAYESDDVITIYRAFLSAARLAGTAND